MSDRMSWSPGDVLEFWFSDRARGLWFASNPSFDDELRERFVATLEAAAGGALDPWSSDGAGALALTILLDQFPRNMYRGSPKAFATDAQARQVAASAIDRQLDLVTPLDRRLFFYLPFEHSESLPDQHRSVELFSRWVMEHEGPRRARADDEMIYVLRHREIIERFGRFPHRNAVLGRSSTPEELAFLLEPRSSF
jgi:uncharacterized protein (DUF924 family)